MAPTLLYLLKANAMLVVFVAAYYGLLRGLTFFGLNRAYLLLALLFAAVYPALPVPALLPAVAAALPVTSGVTGPVGAAGGAVPAAGFDWQLGALGLYAAGAWLLLLRLGAQLLSLVLLRRRTRAAQVLGQPVRVLAGAGGPFSFGRTIYLSEAALADPASLPAVLRHEQAHVRQYHTLDVLLSQLATALAWMNPAAWLLRRAVLDNLEYLADQAALRSGLDRRAYQYSLLRQQPGGVPAPALAFHFSILTLKNRITMLNQPASSTRQLGRYVLAAPLVLGLALCYSGARAQAQTPATSAAAKKPAGPDRYYIDGQLATKAAAEKLDTATIASMQVLEGQQAISFAHDAAVGRIVAVATKPQQQSAAVHTLNSQLNKTAGPAVPVAVGELPPAALAYITSHYPGYRLVGVGRIAAAGKQPLQYLATIALGRRPEYVLFDAQGQKATP